MLTFVKKQKRYELYKIFIITLRCKWFTVNNIKTTNLAIKYIISFYDYFITNGASSLVLLYNSYYDYFNFWIFHICFCLLFIK